jgi:Photosynthesis system II assembly factor YCF48/Putative zinc-finger
MKRRPIRLSVVIWSGFDGKLVIVKMEALPKIVRQRLRPGARPGVHPHADLLIAFAEKTLTERERTRVLEHLSRCEDCREVVFFSTPQPEPGQVVHKIPGRSGWLSWPALRWGAAAACVIVVGTAVTLFHEGRDRLPSSQGVASEKNSIATHIAPAPSGVANSNQSGDAELNSAPPSRRGAEAEQDKLMAKAEDRARPSRKAMTAIPRIPMQFDQSRQIHINGDESGTGASVAGSVSNAPAAPSKMTTKTANLGTKTVSVQQQPSAPQDRVEVPVAGEAVEAQSAARDIAQSSAAGKDSAPAADRAVSGAQAEATPAPADATGQNFSYSPKMKKELARASTNLSPRWMLAPGGVLRRSWDGGKTWETVPVADKVSFDTFAAVAAEIWAGGADGLLYHSSDAGLHWIRVMPQANGKSLVAGIAGIKFSDAQNGKVTTVSGETWTTSDAGKTWQKN